MKTRPLTVILILAALLRVALFAVASRNPAGLFAPDSQGYVELSENLADSGRFQRHEKPEIFRTPGYPFFLLPGWVSGEYWWVFVVLAQIGVDVVLVYLTYLLGCMLCNQRVGLWGAGFQCLSAVAIASSLRILSDGLFAFLLTLAILVMIHHFRTGRLWSLLGAAAVMAMGCYVRPVGLLFAAMLFLALFLRPGRWKRTPAFALVIVAATLPWVLRNRIVGEYWGFSGFHAQVAFDCLAPSVLAEVEDISFEEAGWKMDRRLYQQDTSVPLSPGAMARRKLACAREVLGGNWWRYAKIHARGDLGVWVPGATDVLEIVGVTSGGKGTVQVLRKRGFWAAVRHYFGDKAWAIWLCGPFVLILLLKYLTGLVAVGRYVRLRMGAERWLVLATILLFVLIPGPAGHPRYRTPVEPLLSVTAAAGVVLLAHAWGKRTLRRKESKMEG